VRERVTVHRVLHRIATEQGARRGYADADHPLVGREPETEMLKCRWEAVREGEGQVLIIRGEPGIGKSRLAETVFEDADGPPPVRFRLQCSSYYSKSFLHPFIELISDRAGIEAADRKAVKDEKLTALLQRHGMSDRTPVGVFSELLSIRAKTPQDVAVSSERWKENTLRACSDFLLHVARTRPTQIFVEDAHWADATSLELLDLLVSRIPQLRAMLLVTSRTGPTLRTSSLTHVSSLQLNRLTRGHSIQIVRNVAGDRPLSGALVSQVLERSDGVPLFLEEITKTLINRIGGTAEHGDPGANALEIPVTLEDSLMSRLDRLPSLRETADSASAIGREFSARLVGTVLGLDEEEAHRRLSMLADKGVVFRKDSQYSDTYVFKHALVQDAAYKSMTKARQREMHGRIAAALEDSPSDIAAQSPELLAKHFHEAGNLAKTLDYREAAGRLAIERSATTEAIAHFAEAIRLLEAKNGGAEDQERLTALLTMFGAAQTSVQGYTAPEVIAAYERAWSICEDSGSASSQPEIIYGMWNSAQVGSDYEHAWSLAQMCLSHATAEGDQTALLIANTLCGVTAVLQGRHAVAAGHLEAAVSLYAPDRHSSLATRTGDDPGVESLVFLSLNRWHLGEIDTAVEHAQRSVSLARELAYRHTLIYALSMTGVLLKLRRAPEELMTLADEIVSLSREQEYPYFLEWGNNLKGWALCELGRAERGLSMMSNVWKQGFSSLLFAEGCIKAGYPERGLAVIDTVIASQPCYAADALRIKGQLLLAEDRTHRKAAIDCFHQALRLAREQGANQYVLRAAVSLARHASTEDEAHVARTALHDVVDTIKAPSGCIDLTEAREFLKATAPG
ncbi:MAG: AAA family ATPase, partial [Pseudomonadota bacterium]